MAENISREKELVLAPNEFAFILDKTKGNIACYVGPYKASLSATDGPVIFDQTSKKFLECSLEKSIQIFATAPEGWYLTLKNPAKSNTHPISRVSSDLNDLIIGRKINIPGPTSFPLWPGQMVKTVKGHHLRSNQYLVVRVYDEEAAKENWKTAVVKPRVEGDQAEDKVQLVHPVEDLTIGKLLVIKGTEVSFYIPPTGIEVVPEDQDTKNYVRDAVTLERLEYCILLDENGNKRYVQGPEVVFPKPTETFLLNNNSRKYKAIELNEKSGIYVKVIAEYEEGDITHPVGEELFITGNEQMIYYPRPEHAIIKYDNNVIHYAVAIPEGEGRYVLNKLSGEVTLKKGPCMLLSDPRSEVIVKRILDPKAVSLMFPGNDEALRYNMSLASSSHQPDSGPLTRGSKNITSLASAVYSSVSSDGLQMADGFDRKTSFTPPRTVTLDSKYDGAVLINVWTGYAIQVVGKTGNRKVIEGPAAYLLAYDETLEAMELSTGKPKTTDDLLRTVYLRVKNNKVSDIIAAESKDYCGVEIKVSYCVNFEGTPDKWFNAENYVKLLCDHMRSIVRAKVKGLNIDAFYGQSTTIVRDTILGLSTTGTPRSGFKFEENDMRIYDVEVLNVQIKDQKIANTLITSQQDNLYQSIELDKLKKRLEFVLEEEKTNRKIEQLRFETRTLKEEIKRSETADKVATEMAEIKFNADSVQAKLKNEEEKAAISDRIRKAAWEMQEQERVNEIAYKLKLQGLHETDVSIETEAFIAKATSINPQLVAVFQNLADRHLLGEITAAMSPMAIANGKSVVDVIQQLMKGTALEEAAKLLVRDFTD